MAVDNAERLINDVLSKTKTNQSIPRSAFIGLKRALHYADRNKRKMVIMVGAAAATAVAAAATGGVALAAVGIYAAGKAGGYIAMRVFRRSKRAYYMRAVSEVQSHIDTVKGETLSMQRVDGDLVERRELSTALNKLRYKIHHWDLINILNDFHEYMDAKKSFDAKFEERKSTGLQNCGDAIHLVEKLGRMEYRYNRLAETFDITCELATYLMLARTRMDVEFARAMNRVLDHMAEVYPRSARKAKFKKNPLLDLLNEAANDRAVLRHWNERGGKDHSGWVFAVMNWPEENGTPSGNKFQTALVKSYRYTGFGSTSATPLEQDQREVSNAVTSGTVGVALTGVTTAPKAVVRGVFGEEGVTLPLAGKVAYSTPQIVSGAAIGVAESIVGAAAEALNTKWNRYMIRKGREREARGEKWEEKSKASSWRSEAKSDFEKMIDKFLHLLEAHDEFMAYAKRVPTFSKGFDTMLVAAVPLMRRQKLYYQVFAEGTGLFQSFAEFYEAVAFPAVVSHAGYLGEDDHDSSGVVLDETEKLIRTWLVGHKYTACDGHCYMAVEHLPQGSDLPAIKPEHYGTPVRPIGSTATEAAIGQ